MLVKYLIKYRDNYLDDIEKYLIVFAESTKCANDYFFNHYSGIIFRTEFIGYA